MDLLRKSYTDVLLTTNNCEGERKCEQTLRSSNFSVKSMILANWWNSACCESRCWRGVMSFEHRTLNTFGTVASAHQTTRHRTERLPL